MASERTEADLYADGLIRVTHTVAEKLRRIADRLEMTATVFAKPDARGGAVGVAADLVNDYTQGVGAQGTFFWTIVRDAAELDRVRQRETERSHVQ